MGRIDTLSSCLIEEGIRRWQPTRVARVRLRGGLLAGLYPLLYEANTFFYVYFRLALRSGSHDDIFIRRGDKKPTQRAFENLRKDRVLRMQKMICFEMLTFVREQIGILARTCMFPMCSSCKVLFCSFRGLPFPQF